MNLKQVIIVRKDLKLGVGKVSSQVAHASVDALEKTKLEKPALVEQWKEEGQKKVVLKVQSKKELLLLFKKLKEQFPTALIKDAGRTQIPAGEPTCLGVGPVTEKEIDKYTKELKLL